MPAPRPRRAARGERPPPVRALGGDRRPRRHVVAARRGGRLPARAAGRPPHGQPAGRRRRVSRPCSTRSRRSPRWWSPPAGPSRSASPSTSSRGCASATGSWTAATGSGSTRQSPLPRTPRTSASGRLDDTARAAEVAAFLEAHSPTADTQPGRGERWFAIEEPDGSLAAVAAWGSSRAGAPHLSSVAVDTRLRGRGLGRTIVGALTRWAVAEAGVCTLGMYSHNAVARGLYLSLGYDRLCAWSSRPVMLDR